MKIEEPKKSIWRELGGWLLYIIILLVVINVFVTFVGQQVKVDGASMEYTLQNNDALLVDKVSYRFKEPKRFDIVIFPSPYDKSELYIKRIIGLPGETVQINKKGEILIDGEILEEDYGAEVIEDPWLAKDELQIATNEYFVLGDNRNVSSDSRDPDVGMIKESQIKGKAFIRIWPLKDFGLLKK